LQADHLVIGREDVLRKEARIVVVIIVMMIVVGVIGVGVSAHAWWQKFGVSLLGQSRGEGDRIDECVGIELVAREIFLVVSFEFGAIDLLAGFCTFS